MSDAPDHTNSSPESAHEATQQHEAKSRPSPNERLVGVLNSLFPWDDPAGLEAAAERHKQAGTGGVDGMEFALMVSSPLKGDYNRAWSETVRWRPALDSEAATLLRAGDFEALAELAAIVDEGSGFGMLTQGDYAIRHEHPDIYVRPGFDRVMLMPGTDPTKEPDYTEDIVAMRRDDTRLPQGQTPVLAEDLAHTFGLIDSDENL